MDNTSTIFNKKLIVITRADTKQVEFYIKFQQLLTICRLGIEIAQRFADLNCDLALIFSFDEHLVTTFIKALRLSKNVLVKQKSSPTRTDSNQDIRSNNSITISLHRIQNWYDRVFRDIQRLHNKTPSFGIFNEAPVFVTNYSYTINIDKDDSRENAHYDKFCSWKGLDNCHNYLLLIPRLVQQCYYSKSQSNCNLNN